MKEKDLLSVARIVSSIFTPYYLPLVAILVLFMFTYLNMLPLSYKIFVLIFVYLFTVLFPTLPIQAYKKYAGPTFNEIGEKEKRMIPYIISIVCYFTCYYLMIVLHIPHFMGTILVVALAIQIVCAIINIRWKISTHSAAIGGFTGGVMGFSLLFSFNPLWWLCLLFLLSGIVGTSRILLKKHSLSQVVVGFLVGLGLSFYLVMIV